MRYESTWRINMETENQKDMDEKGTSMDYDRIIIDDNVCENHEANVSAIDVTNYEVEPFIAMSVTRVKKKR